MSRTPMTKVMGVLDIQMDISIIAKILGHNSVKTTEKYYLSICDKDIGYMYYKCS